jgi:dinuclear metal center YbgI/SA1388 family protein
MSTTVADVLETVERLWPVTGAESWDAPGLVSGDGAASVRHLHLAVDATLAVVEDAADVGADFLLVHHPLLLRGVTTIAESTYPGSVLAALVRSGIALLAAHTNADVVSTGTSAVLAARLGLLETVPLDGPAEAVGIGRVGRLPAAVTLGEFASRVSAALPATAGGVRVAGEYDRHIETVALCAGAGDSYLSSEAVRSADVYVTSDLRHHPASGAREVPGAPALVDVSHWASEWLWLSQAAAELRAELPGVEVTVSDVRTDPWDFIVVAPGATRKAEL